MPIWLFFEVFLRTLANLTFFEARSWNSGFFWTPLDFLEIRKPRKIWLFLAYFQSDKLGSGKTLSELHIHCKSLVTRVYYHAGCKEYCKNFTVALKMIGVIDEKQMPESAVTPKEYASKDWTCVISMVSTSFHVYFVCGCARFLCICLKTAIWLFGTRSGFFGEDRLATLLCSSARFDFANWAVRQTVLPHTCARLLVFDETLAQPHSAVVNCSDAVIMVLFTPLFQRAAKILQLWCPVSQHWVYFPPVSLTWSASLYSVQCVTVLSSFI